MKQVFENATYDAERALYGIHDAQVQNCRFDGPADGESAMKESSGLSVRDCYFNLRYPFWHVTDATIEHCEMTENCRAALWYDRNVTLAGCTMNGIKALRECADVALIDSTVSSPEFLWRCHHVRVSNSSIRSEYPFFECGDLEIDRLRLDGKYSFQYVEDGTIRDSFFHTKDAFWHSRNLTVTDTVLEGEYLGWYSENLRLIRCRIVGTQPLCYCRGLVLEDCTMENTDLAFERSEVEATVRGHIDSVKNPAAGRVVADDIGEIIMEPDYSDAEKVKIEIRK